MTNSSFTRLGLLDGNRLNIPNSTHVLKLTYVQESNNVRNLINICNSPNFWK